MVSDVSGRPERFPRHGQEDAPLLEDRHRAHRPFLGPDRASCTRHHQLAAHGCTPSIRGLVIPVVFGFYAKRFSLNHVGAMGSLADEEVLALALKLSSHESLLVICFPVSFLVLFAGSRAAVHWGRKKPGESIHGRACPDCATVPSCGMGAPMKVAVIGAGRRRNGIGEFIAKYLHANGGNGLLRAQVDNQEFRKRQPPARHVWHPGEGLHGLLRDDTGCRSRCSGDRIPDPDPWRGASKGASRPGCMSSARSLFSRPKSPDPAAAIEGLFRQAHQRGVVIAMNSQWPFCLPPMRSSAERSIHRRVGQFAIRLSPRVFRQGDDSGFRAPCLEPPALCCGNGQDRRPFPLREGMMP
ncbi:MAG: hypothetical protein MZV70_42300 [Desulfobacterales bacterium]|nr:hypothetical protein [Desulfobacterales bacterium]